MIKASFSSLYFVCSGYIIYLGFVSLIGYILQVIVPKYYVKEAGIKVGLKRVAVIQQI
jgi:peptidoglycan biosynthesis protein MviN/MurJ (putative lipid II flippase)